MLITHGTHGSSCICTHQSPLNSTEHPPWGTLQDAFGADFDDFTSATVALGLGSLIVHDDGGCSHWEIPVMLANNLQVNGRYEADS